MNEILITLLVATLVAILLNLPVIYRAKRMRRLAEARLEIAKVVTEMEKRMLSGDLKVGEVCHDALYKDMVRCQAASGYRVSLSLSRPSVPEQELRKRLHEEIANHDGVGALLKRYIVAHFRAFRQQRPFMSLMFLFWVAAVIAGILGVFSCVKLLRGGRSWWKDYKQSAAEWLFVRANGKLRFGQFA